MLSRNDQPYEDNFNFGVDNLFLKNYSIKSLSITPPSGNDFLLLDGSNFLLLDNTNMLLL